MKRLQRILKSNVTYVFLSLIAITYLFWKFSVPRESIYSPDDSSFEGVVARRVITDNKISFEIEALENLICNYYSDDEEEKTNLWNEITLGSKVDIEASLGVPSANTVPNTFNYKEYLYNKGTFYTCTIRSIEVSEKSKNPMYIVKNFIIDRIMSFDTKDYLYTMIIGDKSLMDEEILDEYRENGITHLFAISGMHIGLFAAIIIWFLKKFGIKDKSANIIVAVFIWFYAFLAGFGASVMRAGTLFTFLAIDKLFDLKIDKIKILLLAGFTLVFSNYRIITDIGFIYSFVTTFGLIWANKTISKHKVLGTSLVASLYSLPITINNFYKFNLASILFNVIFVPFVSAVIYPLCLLTFFVRWCEPALSFMIRIMEFVSSVCANIGFLKFVVPEMSIWVVMIYYMILLLFMRKNLYKVSFILLGIVFLNKLKPILDTNAYVTFLDVGQGDSAIIIAPRSEEVILIDTGGKVGNKSSYKVSDNTITYLNSLGVDRIDYLILTHGDADHAGDAMNIIEKLAVKHVILNKGEHNVIEKKIISSGVNVIDSYGGNLDLKSLNDKDWKDENSNSIVNSLRIEGFSFLFMGDAGIEVEEFIQKKYNLKNIDILKVGHHGSKTSSGELFINSINPKYSIISVGQNNRYGHPNKEVLNVLDDSKTYRTDVDGSIVFKIKANKLEIETCSP